MSATAAIMAGIGAAGSLGGAAIASHGAGEAANTQASAANYAANLQAQEAQQALDFQKLVYGNQQSQIAPFLSAGQGAITKLSGLLGVNPYPQYNMSPLGANVPLSSLSEAPPSRYPQNGGLPSGYSNTSIPGAPTGSTLVPRRSVGGTGSNVSLSTLQGVPGPTSPSADFGSLMEGWNQPFVAPTGATESNDPGYQFRLNQGQQALERSAAARGNLLTGGTAKAQTRYAQDYASNEYQNVYNRALQDYQQSYNIFQQNQANQFNRLASLAGIGQTSAGQLNSAGSNAAGNVSNILLGSGSQIGGDIQNAAAARASGYVGGANAWSGALSGLGGDLSNLVALKNLLGSSSAVSGTDYGYPSGPWSP